MTPKLNTVYLIGGDPDLSLSMQYLLETHRCLVKKIDAFEHFIQNTALCESDVLLLDFNKETPTIFKFMNQLMRLTIKPRIMITANGNSNLRLNDVFLNHKVDVLFHPVSPKFLVQKVLGTAGIESQ